MIKPSLSLFLFLISTIIASEFQITVGDKAPPISLFKLESNKYFRSKDYLGEKNLVVSFFATWCVPCAKEIPELIKLSEEFSADFEFILIDVNEKRNIVRAYVDKNNISLPVIWDKYGVVFEKYGGGGLPLLAVINKKGHITYLHSGYEEGDEKVLKNHLETF